MRDRTTIACSENESDKFEKTKVNFHHYKAVKFLENFPSQYRLEERIGEGAFGSVYKATHISSKMRCAVKVVRKEKIGEMKVYEALLAQEL